MISQAFYVVIGFLMLVFPLMNINSTQYVFFLWYLFVLFNMYMLMYFSKFLNVFYKKLYFFVTKIFIFIITFIFLLLNLMLTNGGISIEYINDIFTVFEHLNIHVIWISVIPIINILFFLITTGRFRRILTVDFFLIFFLFVIHFTLFAIFAHTSIPGFLISSVILKVIFDFKLLQEMRSYYVPCTV